MLCNLPTHEIWIEIDDPTGTFYGEALIGIGYTDDEGRIGPHYAAMPIPGTVTNFRPIQK